MHEGHPLEYSESLKVSHLNLPSVDCPGTHLRCALRDPLCLSLFAVERFNIATLSHFTFCPDLCGTPAITSFKFSFLKLPVRENIMKYDHKFKVLVATNILVFAAELVYILYL